MPRSEPPKPWVIGHRGASGLRPEHTLAAYELAIEQGADFIEPDLVPTRDGVLVARHENEISETTDVADHPEFADRRATKGIDGRQATGWFTEDFTLEELRTLRARERLPALRPESAAFDGQFGIVTLDEILELAQSGERRVGVVLELKHAAYFASIGLPFTQTLLPALGRLGSDDFIECFEPGILRQLRELTTVRLVQLIEAQGEAADLAGSSYAELIMPAGLAEIATYADGIGPAKALIVPRDGEGRSLAPTELVADAHQAGLLVFSWTFRSENFFLPAELRRGEDLRARGDAAAEYRQYYDLGVDAVFSDFPADAVRAREGVIPA